MELIILIVKMWALAVITWALYLAIMKLVPNRHNLHPVAKFHAYILLAVGLAFDVLLNVIVGSLIFLEPPHPQRMLLTARLMHHIKYGKGWRMKLAQWLCTHLLDQFDPSGKHCS